MDLAKLFYVDGFALVTVALPTLLVAMSLYTRTRSPVHQVAAAQVASAAVARR